MADKSTTNAHAYLSFDVDPNLIPTNVKSSFLPIATTQFVGAVKPDGVTTLVDANGIISSTGGVGQVAMTVPTGFAISGSPGTGNVSLGLTYSGQIPPTALGSGVADNTDFLRGDSTWQPVVSGAQVTGQPVITGAVSFAAGSNVTLTQTGNTITINSTGGGGGGGTFTSVTAVWTTANSASKNAYTSINPNVANNDGITIRLVASSSPGTSLIATVYLNTVNLTNTYNIVGTFPNYNLVIPVADLVGNVAETANTVTISVVVGNQYNLSPNNLFNVQPVAFTASLGARYNVTSLPYYSSTANLSYEYTNIANITAFGGLITISGESTPRAASSGTGSFSAVSSNGATISGSVTGNGFNGAGSSTVQLSGSVPAVPSYTPAFYAGALAGNTPPVFTTSSLQTPGGQIGSTITYGIATDYNQYVWIATTLSFSALRLVTALGPAVLIPDVTTIQLIASVQFNVFGFTRLDTTAPVMIQIIAQG